MNLQKTNMKHLLLNSGVALAAVGVGAAAHAQDQNDFWGRFNLSYRAAFNISASFSGVGGYAPPGNGAAGTYNDGFVGVDSSGNAGGYTTYWGYNSSSQISGNDILMSRSVSSGVNSGDTDSGVHHGVELSYAQPLGGGQHWHWGIEGAVNWTGISISDSRALFGNVVKTTDGYSLGGSIPPVAPYSGPQSGPGTLLQVNPLDSHSVVNQFNAAQITGSRKIDADLYGIRLGPYLELPVCKHLAFELGAGLSVGLVNSDFSYNESVAVTGLPTQIHAGSGNDFSAVVGGYARAQADVRLTDHFSLNAGVEFDDLGTYDQTVGSETAHLDLSQTIYATAGLSYRF